MNKLAYKFLGGKILQADKNKMTCVARSKGRRIADPLDFFIRDSSRLKEEEEDL